MRAGWLALVLAFGALAAPARAARLDRFFLPSIRRTGLRAVTAGPDGRVWVALRGAIGAVDRDGGVTSYSTGGLTPQALAAGPDGAVWFLADGNVARVANGTTTVLVRGLADAEAIAAGPDGAMYVAQTAPGLVARVTPDGGLRHLVLGRDVRARSLDATRSRSGSPRERAAAPG